MAPWTSQHSGFLRTESHPTVYEEVRARRHRFRCLLSAHHGHQPGAQHGAQSPAGLDLLTGHGAPLHSCLRNLLSGAVCRDCICAVRSDLIIANKSHTLMTGLSLRPLVPGAQQLSDVARPGTAVSVPAKHPSHGVDRDVPLKGNCRG